MRRKTTAALCLILLLPGCGLRAAKDRPAVTPLSCTAPTALSALYPAGGSCLLVTWADYEQNRTTVQLVDANADTVRLGHAPLGAAPVTAKRAPVRVLFFAAQSPGGSRGTAVAYSLV